MLSYPLAIAAVNDDLSDLESALQDNPCLDDLNLAFKTACRLGYYRIASRIINHESPRVDPSDEDNYALRWAAMFGHIAIFKLLIESFPEINIMAKDGFGFLNACSNGHLQIVEEYLNRAKHEISTETLNEALIKAATYGHDEIVKCLLKRDGVTPEYKNYSAIRFSLFNSKRSVALLLFDWLKTNKKIDISYLIHQSPKEAINLKIEDVIIQIENENKHHQVKTEEKIPPTPTQQKMQYIRDLITNVIMGIFSRLYSIAQIFNRTPNTEKKHRSASKENENCKKIDESIALKTDNDINNNVVVIENKDMQPSQPASPILHPKFG